MASFSDNFDRPDGALGANWTVPSAMSGLQIISNQINGAGAPSVRVSVVATGTATFANDQEATITVPTRGNFDYIGPVVRCNIAGATGYAIRSDGQNNNVCRVVRFSGTTLTVLPGSTTNIQYGAGDSLTLRAEGSTITVLKNGVVVQSFTDTNHVSGQPGVLYERGNTSATRGDLFSAADLSAPATRRRTSVKAAPHRPRQRRGQGRKRISMGATLVAVTLPDDYYTPRNPTVVHGPILTPSVAFGPTLNPTVSRTH